MAASTTGPDAAELRVSVDRAVAEGESARARLLLRELWRFHPGPSQAGFVAGRWPEVSSNVPSIGIRLSVLRSCTVEPLVPVVEAGGLLGGLDITTTVGDFNTYAQEILDPSSPLYGEWAPHVVILAVHTRDIASDLWWPQSGIESAARHSVVERVVTEFSGLIETFRERSSVPLLVHDLEVPGRSLLGLADAAESLGQREAVGLINRRLTSGVAAYPDVHLVEYDGVVARVGRAAMTDERKWATMRLPISTVGLPAVADEWLRHLHPLAGRSAKVLVVDLDNTMWGGVVGEVGADGIVLDVDGRGAPYRMVQQAVLDVRERGVLVAVCSKNDHEQALRVIDEHPHMLLRSDDFHALRINWSDKASNLREIAAELNVGVDSLAFLDDNPAERLLIEHELPEVTVLPVSDDPTIIAESVRGAAVFERLSLTDEDRRRSDFYVQQRARAEARTGTPSLESYLTSLGTVVSVGLATDAELARVAQLTRKTNQFNLTTQRYTDQQIEERSRSDGWGVYSLSASDRFGDHGLVGVALVERRPSRWRVDTLLLSCRVIGRDVETALLAKVAADALEAGASGLRGEFIASDKNAPARDFYSRHGFFGGEPDEVSDETEVWCYDLNRGAIAVPDWIQMEDKT